MSDTNGTNTAQPTRLPPQNSSATRSVANGSAHRVPPHSMDAEMGVLGSMLMSPREAIGECVDKVSEAHFFVPSHQIIFSVLIELFEKRQAIDLITFTQILRDRNLLDRVGGAYYITSLFTFVPTAANLDYYLEIVRGKFKAREIIRNCTELVRVAYEEVDEINVVLDQAQSVLTSLAMESVREDALRHIKEGVHSVLDKFDVAYKNRGDVVVTGLATGFHDLDRMLSGLKPQQMITIAGMTSQGKTALALNVATHVALEEKKRVAIWSMEMSYDEISERFVCSVADVSLQRLRDGFLSKQDFEQIPGHAARLTEGAIYIDDTRGLSINDYRARARRAVVKYDLQLLIVDQLQLMSSNTRRGQENRAREIAEITGGLKGLAKELNVPLILMSHVNRDADKRAAVFRRPRLGDLKESSAIEQDSDVVIFVYRPGRFAENDADRARLSDILKLEKLNEKYSARMREMEEIDGQTLPYTPLTVDNYAELIVGKQRNGPVGEVKLRFEGDVTRFENVTPKMWSNNPKERQG